MYHGDNQLGFAEGRTAGLELKVGFSASLSAIFLAEGGCAFGAEPTTFDLTRWRLELKVGFEPTTCGLRNRCSTAELLQQRLSKTTVKYSKKGG